MSGGSANQSQNCSFRQQAVLVVPRHKSLAEGWPAELSSALVLAPQSPSSLFTLYIVYTLHITSYYQINESQ